MALQSSDAGSATTRTYEIQRFSGGRWMLDSVADDKKVALEMAAALMKSGRAPGGVQVMSVQQGRDGQFNQISIHRAMPNSAPTTEKSAAGPKAEVKAEVKKTEVGDFKSGTHPDKPKAPKKGRFKDVVLALKVAFGLGLCVAIFEAYRLAVH